MNRKSMSRYDVIGIILLMTISIIPLSSSTVYAQEDIPEEELKITGLSVPRVDGYLDKATKFISQGFIGEWDDAPIRPAEFLLGKMTGLQVEQEEEEEDPIQPKSGIQSKWVSDNFYFAMEFPRTLSSFSIQFDINQDGILSNGDAKLVGQQFSNLKGIQLNPHFTTMDGLTHHIYIYRDGVWWDPTEMNPNLWDSKKWDPTETPINWDPTESGFSAYATLISNVGHVAFTNCIGCEPSPKALTQTSTVEAQFSPFAFESLLKLADQSLASSLNLNAIKTDGIDYAVSVETTTGATYGYPGRPAVMKDNQNYVMETYVLDPFDQIIPALFRTNIGVDHIEVTQTIQTANNDLSLIQNKQSLARVFVDNPTTSSMQVEVKVTAYAFAIITIIELGSLSQTFTAPVSPDRKVLADSANFDMPDDWTAIPWLILKAEVSPIGLVDTDSSDNSLTEVFTFRKTHDLNIYYIRVNEGTAAVPDQVSSVNAQKVLDAFTASFPVANPTYVELDWSTLGVFTGTSAELKTELEDIAGYIVLAILIQIILGETDLLPIPDQVFAITDGGIGTAGGSSTPSWAGMSALAAWGSRTASSGDLVMAHEVMHNLGNNDTGRHVGNFDEDTWGGRNPAKDLTWGCGASGPDSAWPTTTDGLNQLYPDALGWNPGSGLVQATKDDLMSYCNSGSPRKWVSDYRWEALTDVLETFNPGQPANSFMFNSLVQSTLQSSSALGFDQKIDPKLVGTTRIVSGYINSPVIKAAEAVLKPSFVVDGTFNRVPVVPDKSRITHYLNVWYKDKTSIHLPIVAEFTDYADSDHLVSLRSDFTFWIPDNGTINKIEIADLQEKVIVERTSSGWIVDPTKSVLTGAPLDVKRGAKIDMKWDISNSGNKTNIFSQLQFSHDGRHWTNLGSPTLSFYRQGIIITNTMPGGNIGFRVLVSNGFDSYEIRTTTQTKVPLLLPTVQIQRNKFWIPETEKSLGIDQVTSLADPRPSPLGSFLSFSARAFDPQKGVMSSDDNKWTVEQVDAMGVVLDQSAIEMIGPYFRHKFTATGLYRVTVSITAANGQVISDSIEVKIIGAAYVSKANFDKFQEELVIQRKTQSTTGSDGSKTTSSSELPIPLLAIIMTLFITGTYRRYNKRK